MPEMIAFVLQKLEVAMEKYVYWKVTGAILAVVLLWQLSNIISAFAKLVEVILLDFSHRHHGGFSF